jgi:hypothetical protein
MDLKHPVAGSALELGELRVRPLMAGYGYQHRIRRSVLSAELLGGYAFNSFSLTPAATAGYRERLNADSVSATVGNSLVLKPELGMWFDVSRKVGINVTTGYLLARPNVTVTSSAGREVRRVRADVVSLKVGLVYSFFHKR